MNKTPRQTEHYIKYHTNAAYRQKCKNISNEWRKNNKEWVAEYRKKYYLKNRKKINNYNKLYLREYYKTHKKSITASVLKWQRNNKERFSKYNKQWYAEHRDYILDYQRKYRIKNAIKLLEYSKKYREKKRLEKNNKIWDES